MANKAHKWSEKLTETMQWIEHKGVRILECDLRNHSGKELAEAIGNDATQFLQIARDDGLQDQLQLIIMEGTDLFSGSAMTEVKRSGKIIIPYFTAVAAVVSNKAATYALKLYGFLSNTNTEVFNDVHSAKEWPAQQVNS